MANHPRGEERPVQMNPWQSPSMHGDRARRDSRTCGERTCTPFVQLSHPGTPRPEWRKWQATAGFLARGSWPAPPSRANRPSGIRCRLSAHSCGGSSGFAANKGTCLVRRARYSLLVRSDDQTPSARVLHQTETGPSQSLRDSTKPAGCRRRRGMILSPAMDLDRGTS